MKIKLRVFFSVLVFLGNIPFSWADTTAKIQAAGRINSTAIGITVPGYANGSLPAVGDEYTLRWRTDDGSGFSQGPIVDTNYGNVSLLANAVPVDFYCPSAAAHTARTCLDDAVSTLGSTNQHTILIPNPQVISADLTITSNLTLVFQGSGRLDPDAATTTTINGPIIAPLRQIFGGSGTVVFGANYSPVLSPTFFGGDKTGVENSASAFTAAIGAINSDGTIVVEKDSTYRINSQISIGTKDITIYGGGTLKLGGNVSMFNVNGGKLYIDGIQFTTVTQGVGTVVTADSASGTSQGIFTNNTVTDYHDGFVMNWHNSTFIGNDIKLLPASALGGYGIHLAGANNRISNNRIEGGRHGVYFSGGGVENTENNIAEGNIITGSGAGCIQIYATSAQNPAQYNRISNNNLVDCLSAPIAVVTNSAYNVIENNIIVGFASGHGISIEGESNTGAGRRPVGNTIQGNMVIGKVANDTTYFNMHVQDALFNKISGNSFIRPLTDTSNSTLGLGLDSSTTPKAYGDSVIGNRFIYSRFSNGLVDKTSVLNNTFYNYTGTTSIDNSSGGTANIFYNDTGPATPFTTFTNGDTTPTVAKGSLFVTANTGATSLSTFDNGYEGQEVTVVFGDGNTTLIDYAIGAGFFKLKNNVNYTPSLNCTMVFIKNGGLWYELSRKE